MAHTAPSCHQEKLLLGHLTNRSMKDTFQHDNKIYSVPVSTVMIQQYTRTLTCCGNVAASL